MLLHATGQTATKRAGLAHDQWVADTYSNIKSALQHKPASIPYYTTAVSLAQCLLQTTERQYEIYSCLLSLTPSLSLFTSLSFSRQLALWSLDLVHNVRRGWVGPLVAPVLALLLLPAVQSWCERSGGGTGKHFLYKIWSSFTIISAGRAVCDEKR